MSHNKSARKRESRRAKTAKKYQPLPHSKSHSGKRHLFPSVMGNLDYDGMNRLFRQYSVASSQIICGYLRQPIDYSSSDNVITGYCALSREMDHKCTYKIPREKDLCYTCALYKSVFGDPEPQDEAEPPSPLEDELEN